MEEILEIYSKLPDGEKLIFTDLLNDILTGIKIIEKNKNKKSIKAEKIQKFNENTIDKFNHIIKTEFKDSQNIDISSINDLFFGKGFNNDTHKIIFFPVYKGEITDKNNSLFTYRRDFVNLLHQYNLIYISDFNISKEYKTYLNKGYYKELEPIIKDFDDKKQELEATYGEDIINQQFEILKQAEKKLDFITFKEEDIRELLEKFNTIDLEKLVYKNHCLQYKENMYCPKKFSDRDVFLNLFFTSKHGKKSFSYKEIIDELNNGSINDRKVRQRLLDLRNNLNKTIEKKLKIKKLFVIEKEEYKNYITLNI